MTHFLERLDTQYEVKGLKLLSTSHRFSSTTYRDPFVLSGY